MEKKYYSFVDKFDEYRNTLNTIDKQSIDYYRVKCNDLKIPYFEDIRSIIVDICPKAVSYLKNMSEKDEKYERDDACKYLYYWIYHDVLNEKKDYNIFGLLLTLILENRDIFSDKYIQEFYTNCSIHRDDLQKLTVLYDIHKHSKYIKEYKCEHKNNDEFCNAIKKIIDPNNTQMKNEDLKINTSIKSTISQYNVEIPIIITIVVTLLIYSLIFIMYKVSHSLSYIYDFKLYRSHIRIGIKSIKKKINNIEKEWKNLQNTDIFRRIIWNGRYNILYYSD
ncbi:variable surface protein [Plasmodium gonderi]|uniref:Variable surface protein n=1 Tax=Plasmodium gonderi TaxID=77519 RepID=A0A1Y1JRP8_PLAGO|nr:variable surface protein [Plasmodium gonderi]GAW84155.1 variable surface protein [Plasmodium gonderi]